MKLSIGLWNANGLQRSAIDDALSTPFALQTDILLISETWLLHPNRLPTSWNQFHNYGTAVPNSYRGSLGISLLVNPAFTLPIHVLPHSSPYLITARIGDLTIIGTYFPPSLTTDTVLALLDKINLTTNTILLGDFNARLGPLTGDTRQNPRGIRLRHWLTDRQLTLWTSTLAFGIPTYATYRDGQLHQSVIDLVLSNHPLVDPSIQVFSDYSLGSDHRPLLLSFYVADQATLPPPPPRRLWNLSRLAEPGLVDLYRQTFFSSTSSLSQHLEELIQHPPPTRPPIDDIATSLTDLITSALDQAVGNRPHRPKHWQWFWTADLQQRAHYREHCYRKWRRTVGIEKAEWWQRHNEATDAFRRAVKSARRQAYQNFCRAMERNPSKAMTTIKHLRRRRQDQPAFTTLEGPAAAAQTMADHLAMVYDGHLLQSRPRDVHESTTDHPPFGLDGSPFVIETVVQALQRLPSRKAPGADHLRSEVLQPLLPELANLVTPLFQLCWQWSYTPSIWRLAHVCPIYKKGDPALPASFRPISLTSIFRKALEYCLHPTLQASSPSLDIAQGGFRPQRSALDQALCLHDLMQLHRKRHGQEPTVVFLDIKAAYDTVDRHVIWRRLTEHGTPSPLLSLLRNMFDEVAIQVILSNCLSLPFHPTTGVLQGSVLSPHLYSIYIDTLPRLLRSSALPITPSIPYHPADQLLNQASCLLFADDVAIIGSPTTVTHHLRLAEQHSVELGYRWNPSKSAVLNPHPSLNLSLYDTTLPSVDEFIYLGVPFRQKGMSTVALIQHRRPKTLAAMSLLQAIGARPSGFDPLLSSRLYRQFIRPTLEYGLAISSVTQAELKTLDQVQDRCLRLLFGGHPKSSTTTYRHITNLPDMRERVLTLGWKYVRRVPHLPPDCLLHLVDRVAGPIGRLHQLRRNPLLSLNTTDPVAHMRRGTMLQRQQQFALMSYCRPRLGVDPILTVPATRKERSRLLRWRIGWLPAKPIPCPCLQGDTTRRHFRECPRLPAARLASLPSVPPTNDRIHPIDVALNSLPLRSDANPPPYWHDLLWLLREIDRLYHPGSTFADEPDPGSNWLTNRPEPDPDPPPSLPSLPLYNDLNNFSR
jgi:hypothetical protein